MRVYKKRKDKWKEWIVLGGEDFVRFNFLHNTKSPNLRELKMCIGGGGVVWRVLN